MPKLTKKAVDAAKATEGKDVWLWDSELEGFGVRVKPTGVKSYMIRYRTRDAARTQRKLTLGSCNVLTPDQARDLARKRFAQIANGEDPAEELRPKAVEPEAQVEAEATTDTVEMLFKGYVAHLRAKGRAMADEAERALLRAGNNAADALGRHTRAASVTPAMIVGYISGLYKAGSRGAADKHRAYLSAAFAWGMKSENDYTVDERQSWGLTMNPAAAVAKDSGAVGTRDRNLSAAEMRQLWRATEISDEYGCGFTLETAGCIRVLLTCGQRVCETLRLEGRDLDLDAGLWKMPAHKTKGRKREHVFPLPYQIIPTLRELVARHGDGYLFPAQDGELDDGEPLEEIKEGEEAATKEPIMDFRSIGQALRRWRGRLDVNVAHFQTRDIRRTWKSRAHDAGLDRSIRDVIQQHAKNDTGSKHYDRADYLPQMREAMGKWSAWLDVAVTSGNVTAFKGAKVAA